PLVTRTLDGGVLVELPDQRLHQFEGARHQRRGGGVYLVGGGSGLPLVGRMLRGRYGRRVHRSAPPAASTAIGLAIAADPDSGFTMSDRLSRGFGVFRESRAGEGVAFDPIFTRDAALPEEGRSIVTRRYRAAHNLGWFRFVEHAAVDAAGE